MQKRPAQDRDQTTLESGEGWASVTHLFQIPEAEFIRTGPQTDSQLDFETGNSHRVEDAVASEGFLQDRVIHVDFRRKATHTAPAPHRGLEDDVAEVQRQLPELLEDRVRDRSVGPVREQLPGSLTGRAADGLGHAVDPTSTASESTARRELNTPVQRVIYGWNPRNIDQKGWAIVRPKTIEILERLHTERGWGAKGLNNIRGYIATFLLHCHTRFDAEPDISLFRPEMIESYFMERAETVDARKRLTFISEHFYPELWERVGPRQRQTNPPYTAAEDRAFLEWARSQSTAERRHYCTLILALARGAGLRAQEIEGLQADDVLVTGDGVYVETGRLRGTDTVLVPVGEPFADIVADAARDVLPDTRISKPGQQRLSVYLRRGKSVHGGVPLLQRLRNTWVVERLREGMDEDVISRWAGLSHVTDYRDWAADTQY